MWFLFPCCLGVLHAFSLGKTMTLSSDSILSNDNNPGHKESHSVVASKNHLVEQHDQPDNRNILVKTTRKAVDSSPAFYWGLSDWGLCNTDCGLGTRTRQVSCYSGEGGMAVSDDQCASQERPVSTEDCAGRCIDCKDHTSFFFKSGLGAPPQTPVILSKRGSNHLCKVVDPVVSCCSSDNENSIRNQVARLSKELEDFQLSLGSVTLEISSTSADYTKIIAQRIRETQTAYDIVTAGISSKSKDTNRFLPTLQEILLSRKQQLQDSIQVVTEAVQFISQQVESMTSDMGSKSSSTSTFVQCTESVIGFYANVACASCNPNFVTSYVNASANMLTVSETDCDIVYDSCKPSLMNSYGHLRNVLAKLSAIQVVLSTTSMKVTPLLNVLWKSMRFEWLPKDQFPSVLNGDPNLTRLQCVRNSVTGNLPSIDDPKKFCHAFLSPFSPNTLANRLTALLREGISTIADMSDCDGCIHGVLVRMPDWIISGHADLELSLPSEALLGHKPCLMAKKNPSSFFRFSQVVSRMFIERDSELSSSSFPSAAAPLTLNFVTEGSGGLEAQIDGNYSSWSNLMLVTEPGLPLPIWESRTLNRRISVWDKKCSKHADCFDQDDSVGDIPWWFCATPVACNVTDRCSEVDRKLSSTGHRCAKGPCVDGFQAVDGVCPDNAICPVSHEEIPASLKYLSKYQLIEGDDPTSIGVCQCAFDQSAPTGPVSPLDSLSPNPTVIDKCAYALCAGYSATFEESPGCRSILRKTCQDFQSSCPGLACDASSVAFNPPTCSVTSQSHKFSTQAKSFSTRRGTSVVGILGIMVTISLAMSSIFLSSF